LWLSRKRCTTSSSRPRLWPDLTELVSPQGSLLVVMLPTHIEYPLFVAALRRFTDLQPDPAVITSYVAAAGLTTTSQTRMFTVKLPKKQWVTMVAHRFMSLLSTFSDDEIARGVTEIEHDLADIDTVVFPAEFEFVLARGECSEIHVGAQSSE
jgi:hypothetical protein